MKDKAEILLQVDESQSIKNELTLQVKISVNYCILNAVSDKRNVRTNGLEDL